MSGIYLIKGDSKMENENVKPWQSKTMWMSAIVAGAGFCPPLAALMAANPAVTSMAIGGIFSLLRVVSKGKIAIK